jgi:hypothetical protein
MKKAIGILLVAVLFCLSTKAAADTTALSLQVGAGSKYSAINVVDLVTGSFVSATISNLSVQNNNPELATVGVNPTNSQGLVATAIAPGTGTATVSCHLQYTDPGDGQLKSEDKSTVISYTVVGSPHGVKLSLSF